MGDTCKPLKVVLLDAGNTILGLDYAVLSQTLAPGDPRVTPAAVERAETAARRRVSPLLAGQGGPLELEEMIASFARAITEPLGLDPEGAGARRMIDMMMTTEGMDRAWCVPMAGARETLDELRRRGYRLGVVSNGDGHAPRRLAEAGLADPFEVITDSGNVGVEKPHPDIFRITLEQMGADPAEAIHVGDFYEVDVLGARAAGVRDGVLIDPFDEWVDADCHRIPTVADLPELIADW